MNTQREPLWTDPAIVAGVDLNGLGLVRALSGAGVPVIALDTDLAKPTVRTRYGTKVRIEALSGPKFVHALLELRVQFSRIPVLLLTQEASVATVSEARDRLAQAYRFTMPSHALMEKLLSKAEFQLLAEQHGFPIPRGLRVAGSEDMDAVRALNFPCVVKPSRKDSEYAKRFAKAYKAESLEEVIGLWSAMREVVDEIVVQEWIEGGDNDVYFCLQNRLSTEGAGVSFVGRKICQWPLHVGGTASCMPAPEVADELIALTDGFFSAVGYAGLCSMEYKRDRRDGRFYMVEPTVGRTDYQGEIAVLNGINIPLAAYCAELGIPLPLPAKPPPPRAWRDPVGYCKARMAGATDEMEAISPGVRVSDAYFRIRDPMPYVSLKLEAVRSRLSRARNSQS